MPTMMGEVVHFSLSTGWGSGLRGLLGLCGFVALGALVEIIVDCAIIIIWHWLGVIKIGTWPKDSLDFIPISTPIFYWKTERRKKKKRKKKKKKKKKGEKEKLRFRISRLSFFPCAENWISLSKSFQPEDKSPGIETLTLTAPFSIAIVYKLQFLLHYCCTIILYPRGKEINALHT